MCFTFQNAIKGIERKVSGVLDKVLLAIVKIPLTNVDETTIGDNKEIFLLYVRRLNNATAGVIIFEIDGNDMVFDAAHKNDWSIRN